MKMILLLCPLFTLLSCKGQKQNVNDPLTVKQFVEYYNRKQPDSVFHLFSKEMKAGLPLDKTKDFFRNLYRDAGQIENYTLIETKGGFARFRAEFQNNTFWMSIASDAERKISGLQFTPYDGPAANTPVSRNQTKLSLPFSGEWFVFWGGDTKEQNYHVSNKAQRHAFDIVIMDTAGRSYRTDGKTNEDYYAYGQPLTAPCDAEVVSVKEGVKDNIPGQLNPAQVTGNCIVLKTGNNEYLLFAHFQLGSIKVKKGDKVKQGQTLGLCGNSGNSSEPHLHFHIQNQENMAGANGIKCYFEKLVVNGEPKSDYSPVRGERIKNAE